MASNATPTRGARRYLHVGLGAAVATTVAVLAVANRSTISTGEVSLASADLEWLAFAVVLTTGVWVAGTAAQLGSMPIRPPLTQLFAVQVAAGLVNHLVPGGVGGMALNVRYLQRAGMTRPAAVAAVGLNSLATFLTHLMLIAALWALAPAVLPGGAVSALLRPGESGVSAALARVTPGTSRLVETAAAAAVITAVGWSLAGTARRRAAARWLRATPRPLLAHLREEGRAAGSVLLHPGRAMLLWAGSVASPALHALILVAIYNSLSGGLPAFVVALVYLLASSAAALVPSPGGFGALDVALVAGLVTAGAPSTTAVAAVLGYRLITVWVPLVPGALVLAVLLRRRVL